MRISSVTDLLPFPWRTVRIVRRRERGIPVSSDDRSERGLAGHGPPVGDRSRASSSRLRSSSARRTRWRVRSGPRPSARSARSASRASQYALKIREPHGIWGGLNEVERKQLVGPAGCLSALTGGVSPRRARPMREPDVAADGTRLRRGAAARTGRLEARRGSTTARRSTAWPARACRWCCSTAGPSATTPTAVVMQRIAAQGCQVYAPALPGFAGTHDLPEPRVHARRLRPLGRRVPRRRRRRREGRRGRPLLRRRRRHPLRPRPPRAGALARARQLDRRLGVAARPRR